MVAHSIRPPRRRGRARWPVVVGLAIALLGLAWIAAAAGWVTTVYRDGGSLRIEGGSVRVREVLWTEPRQIPELSAEAIPPTTGAAIVVSLPGPRGDPDLFVRRPTAAGWTAPERIETAGLAAGEVGVNSPAREVSPFVGPLGRVLLFASDRDDGLGGLDLWISDRHENGWSVPRNLGPRVNSPYDDRDPTLAQRASILVFSTDRPRGFLVSAPSDWDDISTAHWRPADDNLAYVFRERTARGARLWSTPVSIEAINSPADESSPAFSPGDDFLYFASDRPGGLGGRDIWRARLDLLAGTRDAGKQGEDSSPRLVLEAPENLGKPVNTSGEELAPVLRDGGFRLLIRRPRTLQERESTSPPAGLLVSVSREVEREIQIASLPLRAFAENLGRVLLLLSGSVVLAITAVLLYRTRRSWAVNVLTACFVVALLIHSGLLVGFYFWDLSTRIVAYAHVDDHEQVTLAESIAAKIRTEVMHVAKPTPEPVPPTPRPSARQTDTMSSAAAPDVEPTAPTTPAASHEDIADASPVEPARDSLPQDERPSPPAAEPRPPSVEPDRPALPQPAEEAPTEDSRLAASELRAPSERSETVSSHTAKVATVEVTVDSPADPGSSSTAELATTTVQAPVETDILPPVSRASPEPTPRVRELPVPDQGPEIADADPSQEPRVARVTGPSPGGSTTGGETAPPRVQPTSLELPQGRWESLPIGLEREREDRPAEELIPRTPLPTRRRPSRIASARARLPEHAALGERTTIQEAAGPAESGPQRSERRESPARTAPAPLTSEVAAAEAGPISVTDERAASVSDAALVRLAPRTRPGLPTLKLAARTGHTRSVPDPLLPEGTAKKTGDLPRPPADGDELDRPLASLDRPSRLTTRQRKELTSLVPSPAPATSSALAVAPERLTRRSLEPRESNRDSPLERAGPTADAGARAPASTTASVRSIDRLPPGARPLPEAPPYTDAARKDLRVVRSDRMRESLVAEGGGNDESESAVKLALQWLARHQSPPGHWDVDGFDARCGSCRSPGYHTRCDAAITGLAILCFLGQNHTPGSDSRFAKNTERAIDWLLARQEKNGNLAGTDRNYTMYSHGIATLALSEAYLMTGEERYRAPLRRAVDLILRAQNPTTGGWRYQPKPPVRGDTSITGWQVMALMSARGGGLSVPESTFERCRHWLDKEVGGGTSGGIYGYSRRDEPRVAMVAEGLFARQVLGATRGDPRIEEAARYVATETRNGRHFDNLYLLYYGNLALFQHQGWIWEDWNDRVREHLVRRQRPRGPRAGSWDPTGPWSESGGRVLSTALATLTLEVYYRYLPLYWAPAGVGAPGGAPASTRKDSPKATQVPSQQ